MDSYEQSRGETNFLPRPAENPCTRRKARHHECTNCRLYALAVIRTTDNEHIPSVYKSPNLLMRYPSAYWSRPARISRDSYEIIRSHTVDTFFSHRTSVDEDRRGGKRICCRLGTNSIGVRGGPCDVVVGFPRHRRGRIVGHCVNSYEDKRRNFLSKLDINQTSMNWSIVEARMRNTAILTLPPPATAPAGSSSKSKKKRETHCAIVYGCASKHEMSRYRTPRALEMGICSDNDIPLKLWEHARTHRYGLALVVPSLATLREGMHPACRLVREETQTHEFGIA